MKTCVVCELPLVGSQRKFCSIRCKGRFAAPNFGRTEYRPMPSRNRDTCLVCDNPLTGRQTQYCSVKCKSASHASYITQKQRGFNRKLRLVQRLGGQCTHCGYNKNLAAMHFHHHDNKAFGLSVAELRSRSMAIIETEIEKCELLCGNCHGELHHQEAVEKLGEAIVTVETESSTNALDKVLTHSCIHCGQHLTGRATRFCSAQCKNAYHQDYKRQQHKGVERKITLVEHLGGKCETCGYCKSLFVLSFHHSDAEEKIYKLDLRSLANRSMPSLLAEFAKCQLLCANCHAEIHNPHLMLIV